MAEAIAGGDHGMVAFSAKVPCRIFARGSGAKRSVGCAQITRICVTEPGTFSELDRPEFPGGCDFWEG
jgi:hypothetical protein